MKILHWIALTLAVANLACLLFNGATRVQDHKPGRKDRTVIWWVKGAPVPCKHKTNCPVIHQRPETTP